MARWPGAGSYTRWCAAILFFAALAACDPAKVDPADQQLITAAKQDADSFRIVDCKLPPQVR
jgi:hypothetical protein